MHDICTTASKCNYSITGKLSVPGSVTKIGEKAFMSNKFTSIQIANGVTSIGEYAFSGCTSVHSIDLSSIAQATYGDNAFASMSTKLIYVDNLTQKSTVESTQGFTSSVFAITNGGTFAENATFEEGKLAIPEKTDYTFKGWYENAAFDGNAVTTAETGKTYYAKWELTPVAATMTATTSKSDYLVNTPVDVNIAIAPGTDMNKIFNGSVALTYGDEVEKVELNGKELTEKEYIVRELAQKLTSQSSNIKATLNVTYKKAGKFDFGVALKDASGDQICAAGTQVVVAEEAAELTPATKLYTLTVKNADVTIKNGDEEIKAEKNDKGELIAKVPEKADVTVTYTSQSDAVAFDQWTITTDKTLDVDVKNNPLKFQMPAGGVTIEAMTKDASIEEDEPNILGTAAVVGTAAVGTAILAWQGYQLGTELYLKTALPAGTAIPTNRAELALLVWNHAGKPAPAAVLPADATDTQKAVAWAVENDLLKAAKDNGETYVDTDSVSRVEVIRVWNKAQEK